MIWIYHLIGGKLNILTLLNLPFHEQAMADLFIPELMAVPCLRFHVFVISSGKFSAIISTDISSPPFSIFFWKFLRAFVVVVVVCKKTSLKNYFSKVVVGIPWWFSG